MGECESARLSIAGIGAQKRKVQLCGEVCYMESVVEILGGLTAATRSTRNGSDKYGDSDSNGGY